MAIFFGWTKRLALYAALLVVGGCSLLPKDEVVPPPPPQPAKPTPHVKVGNPYEIKGVTYRPVANAKGYDEVGIASWYGSQFHGKPTANGEIFDMHQMTAAHKTLPLPTMVQVTNLKNGKQVVVRVNDRGPFVGDRLIDMSYAAAKELGFVVQGTAKVRVVSLTAEPKLDHGPLRRLEAGGAPIRQKMSPGVRQNMERVARLPVTQLMGRPLGGHAAGPAASQPMGRSVDLSAKRVQVPHQLRAPHRGQAPNRAQMPDVAENFRRNMMAPPRKVIVQVGAFSSQTNALRAKSRIHHLGQVDIQRVPNREPALYRVRLGPVAATAALDETLKRLLQLGFGNSQVIALQ
uniref:Endolytic peptidoglycan transglycosylase RlpA n=1 Tax=Magnetococcus massalia (strain MO-1) TaxID=451514 RepID=A0A1S7LCN0_MAGMO|nr:putative Rare lipoprotein A [Candidatus Magnetococcus massalia]